MVLMRSAVGDCLQSAPFLCLLLQVLFTQLILPICWAFGNYTLVTDCEGTSGKDGSVLPDQPPYVLGSLFPVGVKTIAHSENNFLFCLLNSAG